MTEHATIPVTAETAHQQAGALHGLRAYVRTIDCDVLDAAITTLTAAASAGPVRLSDRSPAMDPWRRLLDAAERGVREHGWDVEVATAVSMARYTLTESIVRAREIDADCMVCRGYNRDVLIPQIIVWHEAGHVGAEPTRDDSAEPAGGDLAELLALIDRKVATADHNADVAVGMVERSAAWVERASALREVRVHVARLPAAPASEAATEGGEPWTPHNDVHDRDRYRWREIAPDRWREAHAVGGAASYAELVEHRGPLTDAPPAATPGEQGTAEAATEGGDRLVYLDRERARQAGEYLTELLRRGDELGAALESTRYVFTPTSVPAATPRAEDEAAGTEQWRTGGKNPYTVYRVADGERAEQHAAAHFLGSFRYPEDAQRAVEAVNGTPPAPEVVSGAEDGSAPGWQLACLADRIDAAAVEATNAADRLRSIGLRGHDTGQLPAARGGLAPGEALYSADELDQRATRGCEIDDANERAAFLVEPNQWWLTGDGICGVDALAFPVTVVRPGEHAPTADGSES